MRERSVCLSMAFSIAFFDFEHCVVVAKDAFEIFSVVPDFVTYLDERDGSVRAQCLECTLADVQAHHHVLSIDEIVKE